MRVIRVLKAQKKFDAFGHVFVSPHCTPAVDAEATLRVRTKLQHLDVSEWCSVVARVHIDSVLLVGLQVFPSTGDGEIR